MKTTIHRNNRGAMMGFINVCAMVAVMLGVALAQIGMLIGGSRELTNATDAGALNTGRMAPTVSVNVNFFGDESQYKDVAENGQKISLKSVNRMWGKSLLCLMNAEAMQNEGYSTSDSDSHANALYSGAESISNRLADKLNTKSEMTPFFEDMASKQSVRMLGNNATAKADANGWETSLLDREAESNIAVYSSQLPNGFNENNAKTIKASDNISYFKGYTPIKAFNHEVCFVPFKLKEQPHLVSEVTFDENSKSKKPVPSWNNPVPNAFSCQSITTNQTEAPSKARAFVLSNPQKTFDLSIPHSFVKVKLDKNTAHWNLNGVPFPDQTYKYFPPTMQDAGPMEAGAGVLYGHGMVGLEFVAPTIWQCLTSLPGGDYDKLKEVLLQRCCEMNHSFTESDLESLLGISTSPSVMAGVTEFYIYPDDNGKIKVSPSVSDPIPPIWVLTGGKADGNEKEICNNSTWMYPNWCYPEVVGVGAKPGPPITHCTDSVNWTPGTGFDGCLGQIRVTHDTNFYVTGVCTVL